MEKFLCVSDAARLLERSVQTVRLYEQTGKLPAVRAANGFRLFKESDVRRLADELSAQSKKQ